MGWTWLLKIAKPIIKKKANEFLNSGEFRNKAIKRANEKLDIPHLDETQEAVHFANLYDFARAIILDFIEKL